MYTDKVKKYLNNKLKDVDKSNFKGYSKLERERKTRNKKIKQT